MITTKIPIEDQQKPTPPMMLCNQIHALCNDMATDHKLNPIDVLGALEMAKAIFLQENVGIAVKEPK